MPKKIKKNNKIKDLTLASINDLSNVIDVNAVVGKPMIMTDGSTVIPVCKVSMGLMTGGGEYGEIKRLNTCRDSQFAGGSGAVISMKPIGFLASSDTGVKLIWLKSL